jgi:hypothetical protein
MNTQAIRVGFMAVLVWAMTAGAASTNIQAGAMGNGKQGVIGKVIKLSGNFMPGPGATGGSRAPLAVPVYIFKGKVKVFEKPAAEHPALVKKVQAGSDGSFSCPLAPGEYTLVAEVNGKMYLNLVTFEGKDTYWATVRVEEGQWKPYTIEESSGAAF